MTVLEALTDSELKAGCMDYLRGRYDDDFADDVWQDVCASLLKRTVLPVFATPEKARNYIRKAAHNRAISLYQRTVLKIGHVVEELTEDGKEFDNIPDTRPNHLDAWVQQEQDQIEAALSRERTFSVKLVIESLPPILRDSFKVVLTMPVRSWKHILKRRFHLTEEQAAARVEMMLGPVTQAKFAHLRGPAKPPRPSERSLTDSTQTVA